MAPSLGKIDETKARMGKDARGKQGLVRCRLPASWYLQVYVARVTCPPIYAES
jgi:hypothetical protein